MASKSPSTQASPKSSKVTADSSTATPNLPKEQTSPTSIKSSIITVAEDPEIEMRQHLKLLSKGNAQQEDHEMKSTPIFTAKVRKYMKDKNFLNQHGFIAGDSNILNASRPTSPAIKQSSNALNSGAKTKSANGQEDPRIFFNISAPSSAFICGSQGSGKSYTLSCLLETSLIKSYVSKLDNPLTGLLFHYDPFTSDDGGAPCEAAHLSTHTKVRILCSPSNIKCIEKTYSKLKTKIEIQPLCIDQGDLNTKRMLDLMAVNSNEGPVPLYLGAINRILREMRVAQQADGKTFNYFEFKKLVYMEEMTASQKGPLKMRLDILESFMPKSQIATNKNQHKRAGTDWSLKAGMLTIVDLSCPTITSEMACALFNICLDIFIQQKTEIGRIVALDEAHKYMTTTSEAAALTNNLLSVIRLQRHLGTRVFISTQEPTISPKLLDLCSLTFVHRFSSPAWLKCLRNHIAALNPDNSSTDDDNTLQRDVFDEIVKLRVGEALLFSTNAIVAAGPVGDSKGPETKTLGTEYLKIKVRARITEDGGVSVFAKGKE